MQSQKFLAFLEALMTKENKLLVESITLGYLAIHENDSIGGAISSDAGMKMARKKTEAEVDESGNLALTDGVGKDGLVSRALRRMKKHDEDSEEEEHEEHEKHETKEEEEKEEKEEKKDKKDKKSEDDDEDEDEDDDFKKLVKNMKKKIKNIKKDDD